MLGADEAGGVFFEGSWAPGCSDRVCLLRSDLRPKDAEHTWQTKGRFF